MKEESKKLIEKLRQEREKLLYTQNKLANRIGISHTSIARIEDNTMVPTLDMFISLANELGYDLELVKREEMNKKK